MLFRSRYDAHGVETSPGVYGPQTSVVVNQISNVTFQYFDYTGGTSQATGPNNAPTLDTARVRITVDVELDQVHGQPNTQHVVFASDVTLRNNNYMNSESENAISGERKPMPLKSSKSVRRSFFWPRKVTMPNAPRLVIAYVSI